MSRRPGDVRAEWARRGDDAGPREERGREHGEGERDDGSHRRGEVAEAGGEVFYCDLCGSVMLNLHCKLICETCGYKRDCSDP